MSLYEKKIEAQPDIPLDELREEVPQDPKWGVKKDSEGKIFFWFGYKGHLAVGNSSQYILQSLFSSGNLNDGKAAIPLLTLRYQTMDAGYDHEPIYEQIHRMGHQSVIAYNKRNKGGNQLVLINILPLLVFVSTLIVMIVLTLNMKP